MTVIFGNVQSAGSDRVASPFLLTVVKICVNRILLLTFSVILQVFLEVQDDAFNNSRRP